MKHSKRLVKKLKTLLKDLNLPEVILLPRLKKLPSFYLPRLRVIHLDCSDESYLFHEVGHHHLRHYYGTIIDKKEFEELFGNKGKWYFGTWYFDENWESNVIPNKDFASNYAQVHPIEDYSETFVLALKEIREGFTGYYGSAKLNKKVRTVKRWVLRSAEKKAA